MRQLNKIEINAVSGGTVISPVVVAVVKAVASNPKPFLKAAVKAISDFTQSTTNNSSD